MCSEALSPDYGIIYSRTVWGGLSLWGLKCLEGEWNLGDMRGAASCFSPELPSHPFRLSAWKPKPTRGRMRIHSLENVDKALQFLKEQRVHLENVGSHDIVDGNHRLTLGLIWTIILRFQVCVCRGVHAEGSGALHHQSSASLSVARAPHPLSSVVVRDLGQGALDAPSP